MSEQEYADDPVEMLRRKRKPLKQYPSMSEMFEAENLLAQTDKHVMESIKAQNRIRTQNHFAHLASMSNDVVERGQYMVAAGLARVFHYEKFWRRTMYERKKGLFRGSEREDTEEERENVYVEGYE